MFNKIWFRVVMLVILLAVLAGAGFWVYNLGLMNAAAANGELPAIASQAAEHYRFAPYGMHFFFAPFRIIGGLIFLCVVFGLLRAIFFPRYYGHHFHHMHEHGHCRGWREGDVPPMVEEWHRKMHEKGTDTSQSNAGKAE